MPLVSYTEYSGSPVKNGAYTLTPLNRVLQIAAPGLPGGLVWNRPSAVLVEDGTGQVQRLPVPDVTRLVVWSILGAGLFLGLLARLSRRE